MKTGIRLHLAESRAGAQRTFRSFHEAANCVQAFAWLTCCRRHSAAGTRFVPLTAAFALRVAEERGVCGGDQDGQPEAGRDHAHCGGEARAGAGQGHQGHEGETTVGNSGA